MKKRLFTAAFVLLVFAMLAGTALNSYLSRPSRFCYRNYQHIEIGMTLNEVEVLLGGSGKEIQRKDLPQSPDFSEPAPEKRSKPVVSGDRFFQWKAPENLNGGEIIVGMKDDKVCDKWYWEYSL